MPALVIDVEARFAQFLDGLNKIERDVSRSVVSMSKAFGGLRTVLGGIGVGLSVNAFVGMIKGAIDAADHLNDLNKTTRISVEQLSGLKLAATQSGSDLDSIAASLNKLSVNIGKDAEKFALLGVTAKDPLEAFKQLADVSNSLTDQEQRAAVLAEALGKSWAGAAPLLTEGGKAIGEMVKRGAEISGMTKQAAEASDKFNDKLAELNARFKSSVDVLIRDLLPLFDALASAMDGVKDKSSLLSLAFTGVVEVFRTLLVLGSDVKFAFQSLGMDFARAIENVKLIAKGDFAGSRALGELFRKDALERRAALDAWQKTVIDAGKTLAPKTQQASTDSASAAAARAAAAKAAKFLAGDKVTARGPIDRSAERLLEQQLKDFERVINEERDLAQTRNDFLQRFYDDGLIALGDYTKARGAIMAEANVKQKIEIDKEIQALQASKKGQKGDDLIATDTKINDLLAKQADLNRDLKTSQQNLFYDNIKAGKEYDEVLRRIHLRFLESTGDTEGAARLQFSLDNAGDLTKIDTELKSDTTTPARRAELERAKAEINAMRDKNIEITKFNKLADETNRLRNDAADEEERINIAIKTGVIGEIQGLRQINLLRENTSLLLTEQGEKMENIALLTKDKSQMDSVKALGIEIERLNSQLDPLRDKFADMAEHGLGGFFEKIASGTVSAKEAFKSMIADWTAEITRFMVQAAVKQLIAGFASSAAGAGGGGGSAGLAAAMFAEGGQVSGPGTNTSDSIPVLLSNKEFVVRAKPTQEPGAVAFLTRFNKVGMKALQRFSAGGLVGRSMAVAGGLAMAGGGVNLTQNFTVEARTPKETQQQLASSAYQGGMRAYRRNR